MSGFVGILNLDGAPVDAVLLERMTDFLRFRGPDAQQTWRHKGIGLGHAMLCVTRESAAERQPATLDDRLWIVADARVDGRAELIAGINPGLPQARQVSLSTPDSELILAAYQRWGEGCVEHLIGDFSFAIWDAPRRLLFCARDQFGVKPFFYARAGSCFVFSNTLDCIRQHPAVSGRLNDLAIADFLLFDSNQDLATTSFADIQRLPPAHILKCEADTVSVRRYWELSVSTPVQFARNEEYVERFIELMDAAVADRLRTESAGVMMSGGLDSATVAASARRIFLRAGIANGLAATTEVFDNLIPHQERHYAGLVAEALKIPVKFMAADDMQLFAHASQPELRRPEPVHMAWPDYTADHLRHLALSSRVAFTGYGADPALSGRISVHFRQLMKQKRFGRAFADAARYLGAEGRLSRLYLRTRWGIVFARRSQSPDYPGWLNEDLEKSLGLRERWEALSNTTPPVAAVRPEAHELIAAPTWPSLFDASDAGVTRVPVQLEHPFFDLRLVNFLLALPRLPWCCDKQLLREAARGILPEAVRLRRKSPLSGDPLVALLQRPDAEWVDRFAPSPELDRFVIRNRIPAVHREQGTWRAWIHLRPLSLNFWLRR